MTTFAVIGAGAWGTALASHLARLGHATRLWALEREVADEITRRHVNSIYLADIALPETIHAATDLAEVVAGADVVLLVPPSQHMRKVVVGLARCVPSTATVVVATKGIE